MNKFKMVVDGFVFMPVQSLATSITTYVGQNIGAGRMDRVKEGVRSILLVSAAMGLRRPRLCNDSDTNL